jgi:hypothetical protein
MEVVMMRKVWKNLGRKSQALLRIYHLAGVMLGRR